MRKFFVIAKYISKYGVILYCTTSEEIDFDNVYINTFYYKGRDDIKVGQTYEFTTIKGENGLTYVV